MGLVAKLKDKLHHGASSVPTSDSEDTAGTGTHTPLITKIADKIPGISTPVSSDTADSSLSTTGGGGLAAAGGASKHAVKMEKKRDEKEARRRHVEMREEKERKQAGDEDSWAALAGPESTLLTDDYGFLPLMQSSSQDRQSRSPSPSVPRAC